MIVLAVPTVTTLAVVWGVGTDSVPSAPTPATDVSLTPMPTATGQAADPDGSPTGPAVWTPSSVPFTGMSSPAASPRADQSVAAKASPSPTASRDADHGARAEDPKPSVPAVEPTTRPADPAPTPTPVISEAPTEPVPSPSGTHHCHRRHDPLCPLLGDLLPLS
jgi:hypothetical protein